jgi:hypothetical protein
MTHDIVDVPFYVIIHSDSWDQTAAVMGEWAFD